MIEAIPVRSDKQLKAFINLPYKLFRNNRYWVPPIKKDVYKMLDIKQNPFWRHAERELFLAYRDGQLAGRVAAIVDYNFLDFWNQKTGYFGYFECDNDEDAARALFEKVSEYLLDKGMENYIGPMNPSINDEVGILIEGFFTPPFIMMTYNPEYYRELCEKSGLTKAKDLFAFYVDMKDIPFEYYERLSSIIRRRIPDLKIRTINMDDYFNEVKKIKEIYNDAWSRNWGFVPMTDEEINELAKTLKPLLVPELVTLIDVDGVPSALSLAIPNYNYILKKLNGKLNLFGMLKFLYFKKKIKEVRFMIMGVRKQCQKMGLEALLLAESVKIGQQVGYIGGELSWTLEDNHLINNMIKKVGGKIYKKYRMFAGSVNR
ncbi:hypothetical protein A2Y85_06410 [candidate division WOR-3 bacterium RBG_13_43_14]|uniref:N-acetyltransferase domain-containing protein n=1 Tax=candidate division WOR-3 bacterium RBG_13_43_14 TaxID=1802590 RepID=A0A1F4UAI2_UNCW3|nr:MAG: hypothetical protein A2Y85_06410 [candidate division WOR-3 bacterium RBG_13_43_14]